MGQQQRRHDLIDRQLNDYPDEDIKATQERLNTAYDAFTAKYGLINDKKNARLFDDDSSYYLLCSLENLDENKNLKSKADMFTKRTIRPERVVTSVDTPSEALAVSMTMLKKIVLFPISLFVAFLALMAKWLLTLSSYVVAPLMLYIFGCGIYTAYRQTWDQFFILLVAEFICFILFFGATAITEGIGRFSEWLAEL